MFTPNQQVIHKGRPAVVITDGEEGATGRVMYGIRYTDVPRWLPVEGFPNMVRPNGGALAYETDLVAAP
jgi:hypothetical protein